MGCKVESHPLYLCSAFKGLSLDQRMTAVKSQTAATQPQQQEATTPPMPAQTVTQAMALATVDHRSILTSTLLMTAQVIVESSEGSKVKARALLDTGATRALKCKPSALVS